ncbi:MAG: HAD-IA family hydrolase [Cycloclasticus sp.]
MINDYELVVFDWDGTLANSIDWIVDCLLFVAEQQNLVKPSEQACKDIIGLSLSQAMLTLFPTINDQAKVRMVEAYRRRYMSKAITQNDLFLDTLPVLQELMRSGKTLAIATGKGRQGLDRALDGTDTRHFFQHMRCADVMESKPSPHMLFDIMQVSGISPEKTIMIGDSSLDLIMANNAGVASVGITTGAHSATVLNAEKPLRCINNLKELFED